MSRKSRTVTETREREKFQLATRKVRARETNSNSKFLFWTGQAIFTHVGESEMVFDTKDFFLELTHVRKERSEKRESFKKEKEWRERARDYCDDEEEEKLRGSVACFDGVSERHIANHVAGEPFECLKISVLSVWHAMKLARYEKCSSNTGMLPTMLHTYKYRREKEKEREIESCW